MENTSQCKSEGDQSEAKKGGFICWQNFLSGNTGNDAGLIMG